MRQPFFDRLSEQAFKQPEKIAIEDRQHRISYAELLQRLADHRQQLAELGVEPGQRVLVWAQKSSSTAVWLLALISFGAVPAPAHPALKPHQVRRLAHTIDASWLLLDSAHLPHFQATENTPSAEFFLCTPNGDKLSALGMLSTAPGNNQPVCHDPELKEAIIFFTSGSTGGPKGVCVSTDNLLVGIEQVSAYLGLTDQDIIAGILPLAFDYGFSQLTTALYNGAQIYFDDYLLPADLKRPLLEKRATVLAATPGLLVPLALQRWLPEAESLRLVCHSGGHLPVKTVRALRAGRPDVDLYLMYGLTEAFRASYLPPDEVDEHPESAGYPLPGTTLGVIDEHGVLLQAGEVGQIIQGGPLVSMGYVNDPKATRERFIRAPKNWPGGDEQTVVCTGDLGHFDTQGRIYIHGRIDEQLKIGGVRVSPEEIEQAAVGFDQVSEAAAVSQPIEGGEQLVLHIAPIIDDINKLRHYLREQLAPFQQPARIVAHEQLPRSANNKFDRQKLRQPDSN